MQLALLAALVALPAAPGPQVGDPLEVVQLRSLGVSLEAPVGNACARDPEHPNGPLGCTRACYAGHPTAARLPVDPGGAIRLRTPAAAGSVIVRPLAGVDECGAEVDPVGPDLEAERVGRPTDWRLRLPTPLRPSGGVQILVTYGSNLPRSYYARVSTRYGRLSVRSRRASFGRTLRIANRLGSVLVRRAAPNRPLRFVTRLAAGRYRLSVGRGCERAIRIADRERLRVTLLDGC